VTITLRPATTDDTPAIIALLAAEHLPPNELEDWIEHVVVAERDGRVVGAGGLEVYPEDGAGLVRSMVVEEGLQRSGLGKRILDWVVTHARDLGLRRLYLFTMNARAFYARYGFEDATVEDFPPGARDSAQYRFVAEHGHEWAIKAMKRKV
jgi:N-acetylglutamate synthase-like GNAT family acetyltransferase